MRSTVAYSLLCINLATATFYNGGKNGTGYLYEGDYSQASPNDISDVSPLQYGAANPNASNSVPVGGFIWRTNVSDVSVSDATTAQPNITAISNAHVISTVFDLTWPGNGSIGSALQSQRAVTPYGCILMIDGLGLPDNVTSKYTAEDNGSCANVLGDDCVKDFLASGNTPDKSGCPGYPAVIPASCAGTLGAMRSGYNGYALAENLEAFADKPRPYDLQSGQGFAYILSSAYNGSDVTAALQEAESRLLILAIKGINAMACQKVNSTLTVASEPTPAGAAPSSTTNAAPAVEQISHIVLGLGVLGAVLSEL